ncbi:MAG TPA: hypothetical protein VFA86_11330 [Gammaproteobacteria bacterium]|nr:hypothetical protein [Gammaproteobacteria bacterium]
MPRLMQGAGDPPPIRRQLIRWLAGAVFFGTALVLTVLLDAPDRPDPLTLTLVWLAFPVGAVFLVGLVRLASPS